MALIPVRTISVTCALALAVAGCGVAARRVCPMVIARSGVHVDVSAYVAAHHQARRWCVNDVCAPARPPATRLLAPGDGSGPVAVAVTALVGGLAVAADGSVTTS